MTDGRSARAPALMGGFHLAFLVAAICMAVALLVLRAVRRGEQRVLAVEHLDRRVADLIRRSRPDLGAERPGDELRLEADPER